MPIFTRRWLTNTTDITSRKCFATGYVATLTQETSAVKWKRTGPSEIFFCLHNVQFGDVLRCLFGSNRSYPLYFHQMNIFSFPFRACLSTRVERGSSFLRRDNMSLLQSPPTRMRNCWVDESTRVLDQILGWFQTAESSIQNDMQYYSEKTRPEKALRHALCSFCRSAWAYTAQ